MEENEKKKIALVTGASRGIGLGIARRLAQSGMHVLCVSRSEKSYAPAVQSIRDAGGQADGYACDVADAEAVRTTCAEILEKHECVDVLVNNAGITKDMLFIRMDEDDWHQVIQTNLSSCFYWTKGLVRPMTRRRWGRIINISSVIGLTGNAGQANYAAAKAGIIGMSKSLAKELASRSITVNVVAPGFIETDMTSELSAEIQEGILKMIPLKRMGTCDDIAEMVHFLAGNSSSYITGQTFTVDGGMVM